MGQTRSAQKMYLKIRKEQATIKDKAWGLILKLILVIQQVKKFPAFSGGFSLPYSQQPATFTLS
jgi:hypothetical protein